MPRVGRAGHLLIATAYVCLSSASGWAGVVTVGVGTEPLSDWGIEVRDDNQSRFTTPSSEPWGTHASTTNLTTLARTHDGFTYNYVLENFNDNSNSGTLGPDAGGQNYDSEFLGAGYNNGRLVIAIVTGQRPDNGFSKFAPGDIRIETSGQTYGVEVGGSAGSVGSTYELFNTGFTKDHNAEGLTGHLYRQATADWLSDPIPDPTSQVQLDHNPDDPGQIQDLGAVDFYYSLDLLTNSDQHAIIEVAIDLSLFGPGEFIDSIHWSPSCGNDLLNAMLTVSPPPPPSSAVPEPSGFALLALGGASILSIRCFRRRGEN